MGELQANDRGFLMSEKMQLGVNFLDANAARLMQDALPLLQQRSSARGATTLHACLRKNAEREQLAEVDAVYCSTCKEHRQQRKKLDLCSLPEVLVIHLKRFGRDSMDGPLTKICSPVEFPLELDLGEFVRQKGLERTTFQLHGVVNHHGNVGGGHYTAHALVTSTEDRGDCSDGQWFCFNDSAVNQVPSTNLDHEAAYLLF